MTGAPAPDPRLAAVANWYLDQSPPPSPPIPAIRKHADLTPAEAVEVLRMVDKMRTLRRAFG
jgi:hypothetical protein